MDVKQQPLIGIGLDWKTACPHCKAEAGLAVSQEGQRRHVAYTCTHRDGIKQQRVLSVRAQTSDVEIVEQIKRELNRHHVDS